MNPDPLTVLQQIGNIGVATAPALAYALVVLLVTYTLSRIASGRLKSTLRRGGFQLNVAILLGRALWLMLWVVGFLVILSVLGLGLTPLAALVGVAGLAASLSLQAVLQNLVAGVYILAEHPFQIGDFIAVVGPAGLNHEGRVQDIQMRTTHLRNSDDELILVPNSAIFNGVITNRTVVGGFVHHLSLTMPRALELSEAQERIVPVLTRLPSVLTTPAPRLRVDAVEADTWTACVSLWARSYEAQSDAVWAIARAFPEATINGTSA